MRAALIALIFAICGCILPSGGLKAQSPDPKQVTDPKKITLWEFYSQTKGFSYLAEIYRRTGVSFGYAPGPTSLEMFACSAAELADLRAAPLTMARMGRGALEHERVARPMDRSQSSGLIAHLTDFDRDGSGRIGIFALGLERTKLGLQVEPSSAPEDRKECDHHQGQDTET